MADYRDHEGSDEGPRMRRGRIEADSMSSGQIWMKPPTIQDQLSELENELMKHREVLGAMYDKIAPVTGPERPREDINKLADGGAPETSEISRILADMTSRLRTTTETLNHMISRVDL